MQQTSLNAFDAIKHTLGAAQLRVLGVFYEAPTIIDWTNLEIARNLGWDINRITPRVLELRHLGVLEESRTRACHITGRSSIAWKVKKSIVVICSLCGAQYSNRFQKCPECGQEAPR
jgi:hypothetical protein